MYADAILTVSIPRSGFCVFGPFLLVCCSPTFSCFNPSVGILCFRTKHDLRAIPGRARFNPSVGILCFRTEASVRVFHRAVMFQSLGRDSVFSDDRVPEHHDELGIVSIPRSGFCVFGLLGFEPKLCAWLVSIPRSGFCVFGPSTLVGRARFDSVSIPRSGFCVFGPTRIVEDDSEKTCFNPSVGILCFRTVRGRVGYVVRDGFNPSVGILCLSLIHISEPTRPY